MTAAHASAYSDRFRWTVATRAGLARCPQGPVASALAWDCSEASQ